MKSLAPIARISFALLFIISGVSHFQPGTVAYAESAGVPFASLLVPASGVLAIVAALMVATGYRARLGAAGLVAFLVPVTFMMHKFWAVPDPMMASLQQVMFFKNISLIGAALYFVYAGAGAYSLDARAGRTELTPATSNA